MMSDISTADEAANAIGLIDELIAAPSSPKFYGIDAALLSKLKTIRMQVERVQSKALTTRLAPDRAGEHELTSLRKALSDLLTACQVADAKEDLSLDIDGELLDAAQAALDMQYPIIWSEEQVALLEARQADPMAHPYTCGNDRLDEAHRAQAEEDGDEPGLLIPTRRGWVCPTCDYRQFWSHETGGPAALTPVTAPDRDAIARIIDPSAWDNPIRTARFNERKEASLTKADAILSLMGEG